MTITFAPSWATERPIKPGWYWVYDGENVFMAMWDIQFEGYPGKWTNKDTWEDFDNKITHWIGPLPEPEPPK